jgi:hypothetical protein
MGTKSFRRSLDEYRQGEDGLKFVSRALDLLAQKDEILDHGPYLAFVLRVEIQEGSKLATGDNDWISMLQRQEKIYQTSDGPNSKQIKVPNPVAGIRKMIVTARVARDIFPRIKNNPSPGSFPQPDIHAWIPFPQQFGDISEVDSISNYYITQHTQFISESEIVFEHGIPAPGSLVLVDWMKKGQDGPRMPIYKRPLRTGQSGTKSLNEDCEKKEIQTNPPPGQKKKQKNDPASPKKAHISPPAPIGFRNYPIYSHLTPRLQGRKIVDPRQRPQEFFIGTDTVPADATAQANVNYLLASMQVMQYYIEDLALAGWIQNQFEWAHKWPGVKIKIFKERSAGGGASLPKAVGGHVGGSRHYKGQAVDFVIKIAPLIDKNNTAHRQLITDFISSNKKKFMKWRKKRKSRGKMPDANAQTSYFTVWHQLPHDFAYAVIAALIAKGKIRDGGWGTYKNGTARTRNRETSLYYDSYKKLDKVPLDSTHYDTRASPHRWMWVVVEKETNKKWFKDHWKEWRKKEGVTWSQSRKMKNWMRFLIDSKFTTPQVDSWYRALTAGPGATFGDAIPSPETVLTAWKVNNLLLGSPEAYDTNALKKTISPIVPPQSSPSATNVAENPLDPTMVAAVVPPPDQGPGTTGAQHFAESLGNMGTPTGGGGGSKPPATPSPKKPTATTPKKAAPPSASANCPKSPSTTPPQTPPSKKSTKVSKKKDPPGTSQPVPTAPDGTIQYPTQKLQWQKNKYNTALKATMLVIHETGKAKPAYHVAKENYERSQKRKKDGNGWMHFYGGRAGEIIQQLPTNSPALHANWASTNAIGYEVCNLGAISSKSHPKLFNKALLDNRGIKILGPDGNIGGKLGNGKVKKLGLYPGKNYTLPGEKQCLKVWETIKWLVGTSKPHKELSLSIVFPAVLNDLNKTIGTGLHSSKLGGTSKEKVFIWGRFNPLLPPFFKNGNHMSSWKKGQPSTFDSRLKWKVEQAFQHGIVAHQRWQDDDGCFIEFYCLGRALGMTSPDAYFAAIGALAMTSDKIATGAQNVTFLPDYKKANYVKLGRDIWGNSGDINWKQWMSSVPKALPKDRDKKYETGVGIYDKFI